MDRAFLLAGRGLRAFGFGFAAVLIGVHLEHLGLSASLIGVTLGIGLAAASLSGLAMTYLAARVGRRMALSICGLLMAVTGLDLALATQELWLVASGITGMLGAASVLLIAEARLWQNLNTLDFVIFPLIEDGKSTPWPLFTHSIKIHQGTVNA